MSWIVLTAGVVTGLLTAPAATAAPYQYRDALTCIGVQNMDPINQASQQASQNGEEWKLTRSEGATVSYTVPHSAAHTFAVACRNAGGEPMSEMPLDGDPGDDGMPSN